MKNILIATFVTAFITGCSDEQTPYNPKPVQSIVAENSFIPSELDKIVDGYVTNNDFMGSIAISVDGKPFYSHVSGYRDIAKQAVADIDTKYRIGSITKTFTAVLTLMAIENGELSLSTPLSKYFPMVDKSDKITIEHLLNHTSGIPNYTKNKSFKDYAYTGLTKEKMFEMISEYPSSFEPGTRESYSNSNTYFITLILEKVFAKSYGELVKEKIINPLGLSNTYYAGDIPPDDNVAQSYHSDGNQALTRPFHHSIMLGAGGIVSTPRDLTTFWDSIFSYKLISESMLMEMTQTKLTFGLGIQKFNYAGKESFGHRGKVDDFNSIVLHNPEENFTIAVIDNSNFSEVPKIVKDVLYSYFKNDTPSITSEEIAKFVGTYVPLVERKSHDAVFEQKGDKLIHVIAGEFRNELIYQGNNSFLLDQSYAPSFSFIFSEDGKKMRHSGDKEFTFEKR